MLTKGILEQIYMSPNCVCAWVPPPRKLLGAAARGLRRASVKVCSSGVIGVSRVDLQSLTLVDATAIKCTYGGLASVGGSLCVTTACSYKGDTRPFPDLSLPKLCTGLIFS